MVIYIFHGVFIQLIVFLMVFLYNDAFFTIERLVYMYVFLKKLCNLSNKKHGILYKGGGVLCFENFFIKCKTNFSEKFFRQNAFAVAYYKIKEFKD